MDVEMTVQTSRGNKTRTTGSVVDRKKAPWVTVCCHQIPFLLKKNTLLQVRNRAASCSQLFVGFAFILLLLVVQTAQDGLIARGIPSLQQVLDPVTYKAMVTQCDPTYSVPNAILFPNAKENKGCYTFVVAGRNTTKKKDLELAGHIADVLGCPGHQELGGYIHVEIDSFIGAKLSDWLLTNSNITTLGVIVGGMLGWTKPEMQHVIDYTIVSNETRCPFAGPNSCQTSQNRTVGFQNAIDSAFVRMYSTINTTRFTASFREMPHDESNNNEDVVASYGVNYFLIVLCYNFIIQMWM
jgi:hypothetical protein